jgi:predicted Zn-dependent protease
VFLLWENILSKYSIKICICNACDFVSGLCEVETGQSNIILDIEESRGTRKFNFQIFSIQFSTYVAIVPLFKLHAIEKVEWRLSYTHS